MRPQSFFRKLTEFKPIIAAELSSAILTLIAVYLTVALAIAGLVLFATRPGDLPVSGRRAAAVPAPRRGAAGHGQHRRAHRPGKPEALQRPVDEEIARSAATSGTFGVLLLDLDHFKDINDTLGHQYGDDLLADLGPRLAKRIGDGGVVARFGGDEFAILPAVRTENVAALTAIVEDVLRLHARAREVRRHHVGGGRQHRRRALPQ